VWVVSKAGIGNCVSHRSILQKKKEMKEVVMVVYQILLLQE
jgi:hypothetical protein